MKKLNYLFILMILSCTLIHNKQNKPSSDHLIVGQNILMIENVEEQLSFYIVKTKSGKHFLRMIPFDKNDVVSTRFQKISWQLVKELTDEFSSYFIDLQLYFLTSPSSFEQGKSCSVLYNLSFYNDSQKICADLKADEKTQGIRDYFSRLKKRF